MLGGPDNAGLISAQDMANDAILINTRQLPARELFTPQLPTAEDQQKLIRRPQVFTTAVKQMEDVMQKAVREDDDKDAMIRSLQDRLAAATTTSATAPKTTDPTTAQPSQHEPTHRRPATSDGHRHRWNASTTLNSPRTG